ncbi:hypothetical protein PGT21_027930 [Puccinia graminis f. sp. tritici]|uniref:Uncharacterized protein n=1 Tax=Puccinia graminis f. sp. tritici TaxID=56615 RepID=A0A5B0LPI6_PUCGR|nr:hypothetical protein PGT21_027930 [Puccinia graminis f. sp. tritici]KAA1128383.1 hypothetical protein PGTUg99_017770 [Puccinia graminis f. sp. tritici]
MATLKVYHNGITTESEEPQEMDETRPRPAVIIKEADLKYDGQNLRIFWTDLN